MKVFDFNVHLPNGISGAYSESASTAESLTDNFNRTKPSVDSSLAGAHFQLLNPALMEHPAKLKDAIAQFKKMLPSSRVSITLEFRDINSVKDALDAGIDGLKFHSYLQRIRETDFEAVLQLCKSAAMHHMPLSFCTSYGTSHMYDCDNLKLAAYIAQHITESPIILLHSGGRRVLDAMLLADSCKNVFLETSFSPRYYKNGPVYDEIVFAYRKIGASKIIHGSDHPYVAIEDAITLTHEVCDAAGFTAGEQNLVFLENAASMLKVKS